MKILLHDYGGYPFTLQLAENLAARGHEVEYCFSQTTQAIQRSRSGVNSANLRITGIQLEGKFEKYSFLNRRQAEIEHGRLLAQQIARFKPQVVISANTPLDAQRLAIRAAHSSQAKFIFWFQDAIGVATRNLLSKRLPVIGELIGQYYSRLERQLVRDSEQVILIADDFLSLMGKWGLPREQVTVIPNWAPLEEIPVLARTNPWALEHDLADKFVFLYTGILGLKHDPGLFIALAKAFRSNPEVKVVIVAEGAAVAWLEEQKKDQDLPGLVLLPYQPAEVYPQVLASADGLISILSPDAGTYSVPSKVLSYMCAARPLLLAVPVENLAARLVVENKAGLVCEPGDSTQWVQNARALVADRDSHKKMGDNARVYAQTNFDIEQITDKFEMLF